ncbi:MAG TPA: penicillin-binding transpeptidase domain-containing protein [Solirubrobacteraceae bacterium]|nr:penicillin-binding transpeptidase domain-containing protein [Solirubrobacteraceae bacterium]
MNAPIARVFVLIVALFAVLIAFTSRWAVFDQKALQANPLNKRQVLENEMIARGDIRADDGSILARSVKRHDGTYVRRYPTPSIFAHAVGYSFLNPGQAGLEKSRNDELTGKTSELSTIADQLAGKKPVGDDVYTTLDPRAQRVALAGLAGRKGAVVALDPHTGAVKVLASVPGYDQNALQSASATARLNTAPDAPLFDRVTQAGYPPGSTFKVVTAIAALDSGKFTPASTLSGKSPITISGTPLSNDNNEQFGTIDMTTALTQSVNTYFAQVGEQIGKATLKKYMQRLGFDQPVPIDLPTEARASSGERLHGRILDPTSRFVDVGRMAIGQDKLAVTPLQMAMVAAAVANNGVLVRPHLTDRIVDQDGRTVRRIGTQEIDRVMSAQTANEVRDMMKQVIKEGTGTAAALSGIDVAGKTGTASVGPTGANLTQPWFIAFAPADNPRIAVAVTVERSVGGFGGTVAAPIAKNVMEALLR